MTSNSYHPPEGGATASARPHPDGRTGRTAARTSPPQPEDAHRCQCGHHPNDHADIALAPRPAPPGSGRYGSSGPGACPRSISEPVAARWVRSGTRSTLRSSRVAAFVAGSGAPARLRCAPQGTAIRRERALSTTLHREPSRGRISRRSRSSCAPARRRVTASWRRASGQTRCRFSLSQVSSLQPTCSPGSGHPVPRVARRPPLRRRVKPSRPATAP